MVLVSQKAVQMLLLTYILTGLLVCLAAADSPDLTLVDTIPTFNVDSALAIASSATGQLSRRVHQTLEQKLIFSIVAANAVASAATEDIAPSATCEAKKHQRSSPSEC